MPRKQFYRVSPAALDAYDPKSRRAKSSTAWSHSERRGRLYDAEGERVSDGVRRQGTAHPVVSGTALGRPTTEFEALMTCPPGQEPDLDSEGLGASQARVDTLFALMPLRQRQVATMIVFEGLSLRAAGERLALRKSQISRDWEAAKASMASLLGEPIGGMVGVARFPAEIVAALEEMAPQDASELGDYREPAPRKDERPDVAPKEWRRYEVVSEALRRGMATPADMNWMTGFERRNGLPSSFSPGWR